MGGASIQDGSRVGYSDGDFAFNSTALNDHDDGRFQDDFRWMEEGGDERRLVETIMRMF